MPFALHCPNCNALLKAPDKAAGRTLPCPGCKTPVTFPKSPPGTAPKANLTIQGQNGPKVNTLAPKAGPAAPKPAQTIVPNVQRDDSPALPDLDLDRLPVFEDDTPTVKPQTPQPTAPKTAAPTRAVPNMHLDDSSALPDLDLDNLPGLQDDPPAVKSEAPKPAAPKPAASKPAPPKPVVPKMELDDASPLLDLDNLPGLQDDPPALKSEPAKPAPQNAAIPNMELDETPADEEDEEDEDEEAFDDFDVVEDEAEALDEVLPVEDEEEEDEENLPLLQGLEDEDSEEEELEEVDEEDDRPKRRRRSSLDDSHLLSLRRIFVRGQKMSLGEAVAGLNEARHDLIDPETKQRVGLAREVRDTTSQVLRHLVHSSLVEVRVEIRERGRLLATIRRAAKMPIIFASAMLEILDDDDRVLGMFEDRPFSRLMQKPMSIVDRKNRKLMQVRSEWHNGRMEFLDADGEPLGELKAGDGSGKFKFAIVRGRSCQIFFRKELDDRPEDKLCLLSAVIGLDLFDRDR